MANLNYDAPFVYCPRSGHRFIKPVVSIQELTDEINGCPYVHKSEEGILVCKAEDGKSCDASYRFLIPKICVSPAPTDLQKPQKSVPYHPTLPPLKPKSKVNCQSFEVLPKQV